MSPGSELAITAIIFAQGIRCNRVAFAKTLIACKNDTNLVPLVTAGILPPLVALLKPNQLEEVLILALRVQLKIIVGYHDSQGMLATVGVLPPLVALLGNGQPADVLILALGVLRMIARFSDNNMVTAGVLPPLIALLENGQPMDVLILKLPSVGPG